MEPLGDGALMDKGITGSELLEFVVSLYFQYKDTNVIIHLSTLSALLFLTLVMLSLPE